MRRTLATISLVAAMSLLAQPAAARSAEPPPAVDPAEVPPEAPEGFTDGIPVGGGEIEPADGQPSVEHEMQAEFGEPVGREAPAGGSVGVLSTTGNRYFGAGAWQAIEEAAAAAPRTCGLSDAGLTALIAAPVFKESSAATTPSSAPSPMTLSRYDEWNGVLNTNTNQNANHTLYEGRDPYTTYFRAYWHPGVGIWQYDSAGVGAPYTAAERMNVRIIAGDIAVEMAQRYCSPPRSIMGPGPYTDAQRRQAAWWPWWTGQPNCPLCQVEFDNMMTTSPRFARIQKVPGISATGGAQRRTCNLDGSAVECWYIDPSVGVIEGATWWATHAPHGNHSPTVQPAPLSHPFYVVKRGGYEESHWLRADTGYPVDISARRQLGRNARVRSNQAGSGLAWSRTSSLCDPSRGSGGNCQSAPPPVMTPPAGVQSTRLSVGGTYIPVTLDADGNGLTDVFWYAPGPAADYLWLMRNAGGHRSVRLPVGGHYDHVIALDADGDGRDDLLFYASNGATSYLLTSRGDGTFTSHTIRPGAGLVPLVGDFDGDRRDEIFWYGPGARPDAIWHWAGSGPTIEAVNVGGVYRPFVGDFDNNGRDDIFWYNPGAGSSFAWLHRGAGGYLDVQYSVGGPYQPVVGDFDGDGKDDIVWYAPGALGERIWFGGPFGAFSSQSFTVNDEYIPVVADLQGDGRDDLIWYKPDGSTDLWTRWAANRSRSSTALSIDNGFRPIAGGFSRGGTDGVIWYGPGSIADWLWYR